MLALIGVPGIYFHSLFGSRGWPAGVQQTGRNRTINREKCQLDTIQAELADEHSLRSKVFTRYRQLLRARNSMPAFDPHGSQKILDLHPAVFAVERVSPDEKFHALCLQNVSGQTISFSTSYALAKDLLTDQPLQVSDLSLAPYQVLWVEPAQHHQ